MTLWIALGSIEKRLGHDLDESAVLQVLERNGGDDGARTRDLCRDRAAF